MSIRTKKGKFIVFEGMDGSGKSTLSRTILERLGDRARLFREPTEISPASSDLKKILTGEKPSDDRELQRLFLEDRLWNLDNQIKPSLAAGFVTLLDRYYYSTAAYQGRDKEAVRTILEHYQHNPEIILPDMVFYLKIDLDTAMNRISLRKKNLEIFEKRNELTRIMKNYDFIFGSLQPGVPFFIADARSKPEELADFVFRKISEAE